MSEIDRWGRAKRIGKIAAKATAGAVTGMAIASSPTIASTQENPPAEESAPIAFSQSAPEVAGAISEPPILFPMTAEFKARVEPFLSSTVGVTTEGEVAAMPGVKKIDLGDGRTGYASPSANPFRDNLIIVKGGVVVFKRIGLPSRPTTFFDRYELLYRPDKSIRGAAGSGPGSEVKISSTRGVAFVINPFVQEVEEVWVFTLGIDLPSEFPEEFDDTPLAREGPG